MANAELVAKLKEGVAAWNVWRASSPNVHVSLVAADLRLADLRCPDLPKADLSRGQYNGLFRRQRRTEDLDSDLGGPTLVNRANLRDADFRGANLGEADLRGADLKGAWLTGASVSGADLRRADLSEADLRGANLRGAHLREADLSGANLSGADLNGAHLRDANLKGACIGFTTIGTVDLSSVKGLDAVTHNGPSIIGTDTLDRSNGMIPRGFLRGCGLRDWEIEAAKLYLRTLSATEINDVVYRLHELRVGQPLQYHSCFISYASKNESFAYRLCDDLQARGVRCWFAPHDMRPGRKIHEQVAEAIQFHDKLLLILSAESVSSDWVRYEVARARKREIMENRRVLFPISLVPYPTLKAWECFDVDTVTDLAAEIRSYFIPDFSDPKGYKEGFERLVSSLMGAATSYASGTSAP